MFKRVSVCIQYIVPQHALSALIGSLTKLRIAWVKNLFIRQFIKRYRVDMQAALIENPKEYATFNDFFTRQLKPELRPITKGATNVASPVDGTIVTIGRIEKNQLFQAKGFYFTLETLLGNDATLAKPFYDGSFVTLYLAPNDYHRVHMPLSGKLVHAHYVPGRLFSVNHITSSVIPQLYCRNERLILIFHTEAGPMAIILVGAMIVGSIQTVFMSTPVRSKQTRVIPLASEIVLAKGAELGYFSMGSTVIVLFAANTITWSSSLAGGSLVQFGQALGSRVPL